MLVRFDDDEVDGEHDREHDDDDAARERDPEPRTLVDGAGGELLLRVVVGLLVSRGEEGGGVAGSGGEGAVGLDSCRRREILGAAGGVEESGVDKALARLLERTESGHGGRPGRKA